MYPGSVGVAQEDGVSNYIVSVKQEDGTVFKVKAEKLIVLELGKEPVNTNRYPHPQSHNYTSTRGPQLVRINKGIAGQKVEFKDKNGNTQLTVASKHSGAYPTHEPAPKPDTICCARCEGTGSVTNIYTNAPMICPTCEGKVIEDPYPPAPKIKGNRMEKKSKNRKGKAEWGF